MKRRLLAGGALLLLIAAAFGLSRLVKTLSFFEVRRIELAGARYLTAPEVGLALAVPAGTSVFDATAPFARRAALLPGVLEARIERRLPGTLRVVVREAEPVALADRGGRLVLLDAGGRVLPFDPTRHPADLPLAEADSGVAGLLARMRESHPELFARIQRATRQRQDIALEIESGRILFRPGATAQQIRDLSLVADVLAGRGEPWRELDARFPPRVIVRKSGA